MRVVLISIFALALLFGCVLKDVVQPAPSGSSIDNTAPRTIQTPPPVDRAMKLNRDYIDCTDAFAPVQTFFIDYNGDAPSFPKEYWMQSSNLKNANDWSLGGPAGRVANGTYAGENRNFYYFYDVSLSRNQTKISPNGQIEQLGSETMMVVEMELIPESNISGFNMTYYPYKSIDETGRMLPLGKKVGSIGDNVFFVEYYTDGSRGGTFAYPFTQFRVNYATCSYYRSNIVR
ncbi:MAG: hypothetical protein V1728_01510 [Candidatus Micrarchaeota archaeon]